MMITPEILEEFKAKMHILHSDEDDNLERLLSFSFAVIQQKCGQFDIATHTQGRSLVFERARYEYNDRLEYFDMNFMSDLSSLLIDLEGAKHGSTIQN